MDTFELAVLFAIVAFTVYLVYQFIYKADIKQVDIDISVQREILMRQSKKQTKRSKEYAHLSDQQLDSLLDELHRIASRKYYRESIDQDQQILYKKYKRSVKNEIKLIKESTRKQQIKKGLD